MLTYSDLTIFPIAENLDTKELVDEKDPDETSQDHDEEETPIPFSPH
jgi:hypothetical protein